MPGSVRLQGTSSARIGAFPAMRRAYQSAPSVATSIDSTASSTSFVGLLAARTALTPAASRRSKRR